MPLVFESVFGFGKKKARHKYQHRSLWNVTTWRLSGKAGYENRHMDPDPGAPFTSHPRLMCQRSVTLPSGPALPSPTPRLSSLVTGRYYQSGRQTTGPDQTAAMVRPPPPPTQTWANVPGGARRPGGRAETAARAG